MRRLMLLRHAKSNWPAGVADRDRPLASRGREAAPVMGRYLAEELLLPDLVLVSPSLRTCETWELVASMLPEKPAMRHEPRIYEAPSERLLAVVQETQRDVRTLLLIGHNPGSEELAALLTGHGDRYAAQRMSQKYPTCGLAVLDFAIEDWRDVAPRGGRLDRFVTPASLGEGARYVSSYFDEARNAALAFGDSLLGLTRPRLRLGVTGLSRSGKTVFTTALIQNLIEGGKLPVFKASAEGRISRVRLVPQPDPDVPRFPYEAHRAAMTGEDRRWPESTRRISELRLEIDYERAGGWFKGPATLTLDIVDYPGEWLLDLALLDQDYKGWARQAVGDARKAHRREVASEWLADLQGRDPHGPADEIAAEQASDVFKAYLARLRADPEAVAVTPPGRFLMPGDLEGSPALTFAPLDLPPDTDPRPGTLAGVMAARFEAYKRVVVTPFFREHFARLDRQIVLVDVLAALDAGAPALADLETALGQALAAFQVGRNTILSSLFSPRIEKVLFVATKADHIHHGSHDRLAAVMSLLVQRALARAQGAGAKVEAMAMAAVRATREVRIREGREDLPAIAGIPEAGETIDGEVFDGVSEAAIFPGELPERAEAVFDASARWQIRAPRFRPPLVAPDAGGRTKPPPQIRLDRALEFLIGDKLA